MAQKQSPYGTPAVREQPVTTKVWPNAVIKAPQKLPGQSKKK